MRDYAKVAPQFWTGTTGRRIRAAGRDVQVIALYLITCPSANMIGLFYLPLPTLCHEIGSPLQGARKALRSLSEGGFAHYDEPSEVVYVPEMARFQIGETMKPGDNRIAGVIRELLAFKSSRFSRDFYAKYRECFHLPEIPDLQAPSKPLASPFEGPSEPLRSQEQEQEQEQKQKQETETASSFSFSDIEGQVTSVPSAPIPTTNGGAKADPPWPSPESLVALYNASAPPEMPQVKTLSDERRKRATKLLRQFPDEAFWRSVFDELRRSPFLRGLKPPSNGRPKFKFTIDWLFANGQNGGPENVVKVSEGKYRDDSASADEEDEA